VPKSRSKEKVTVKVNIQLGPTTPCQRALWRKWWAARIAEVKQSEAKNER